MARLPRLVVPGYPHHVIQRGIDRQAIVRTATDHEALRGFIVEEARYTPMSSCRTTSTCW
jgi:putative transposase